MEPTLLPGTKVPQLLGLMCTLAFAGCASEPDADNPGLSVTQGGAQAGPALSDGEAESVEPEPDPCAGDDARAIQAFRLGSSCAGDVETLAGLCAVGAIANGATGAGEQLCFVSPQGAFFLGFVAHGEGIEGEGFRWGMGGAWSDQLSETESETCADLIDKLESNDALSEQSFSGQRFYAACP